MAKKFRENNVEDQLVGELDSIVYRNKKITREELETAQK